MGQDEEPEPCAWGEHILSSLKSTMTQALIRSRLDALLYVRKTHGARGGEGKPLQTAWPLPLWSVPTQLLPM